MVEPFEPGAARGEDLLLVDNLKRDLVAERWNEIVHWGGGLRAIGRMRHTVFGVLHIKHQKEGRRRALVRQATLRLLEQRAQGDLADELCLVTDAEIGSDSLALLESAGADWRMVQPFRGRRKTLLAGTAENRFRMRGPKAPVAVLGDIRGVSKTQRGRRCVGSGVGWVIAGMRLAGEGEIELPGALTLLSLDGRYQNGILVVGVGVKLNVDFELDLFCLNRDQRPSSRNARYRLGPLIEGNRMTKLIDRLETKAIVDLRSRKTVQEAVWEITEVKRLSDDMDVALDLLPDR
jgi:hypothetical protein